MNLGKDLQWSRLQADPLALLAGAAGVGVALLTGLVWPVPAGAIVGLALAWRPSGAAGRTAPFGPGSLQITGLRVGDWEINAAVGRGEIVALVLEGARAAEVNQAALVLAGWQARAAGTVLVDGADPQRLDKAARRRLLAIHPPAPGHAVGSVLEYIRSGLPGDGESVLHALGEAGITGETAQALLHLPVAQALARLGPEQGRWLSIARLCHRRSQVIIVGDAADLPHREPLWPVLDRLPATRIHLVAQAADAVGVDRVVVIPPRR